MTDSEKMIIVFYVDVSDLLYTDITQYMENVRNVMVFDETVRPIFIPIKDCGRTKIDVINPQHLSKGEYRKIVKRLDDTLKHITEEYDEMKKRNKKLAYKDIEECKNYFIVNGLKIHWNFKLLPKGFEAITLFGHIFDVRPKDDLFRFLKTSYGKVMVNHERIHTLQADSFKLKYFTFYIVYLWYWFIGLFKYGTKNHASYHHIPFEVEAYTNEHNFEYEKSEWKKYIGK